MNIDDQTNGSCNLGDYATSKDDKVPNHLQDHCDGSKRFYKDKTDRKKCQPLKPEEPSQKNVGRRVGKDSDIEGSMVLENIPNPKAAGTEFIWTIPREPNDGNLVAFCLN